MWIVKKIIGIYIIILSVVFTLSGTYYFGNNLLPHSFSELICDLIGLILFFVGFSILNLDTTKNI